MVRPRFLPDNFTLLLVTTVLVASLLPAKGQVAVAFNLITTLAIGLLFFLHGAKLSREAVVQGALHWRLHLTVLLATFALFPLLGLVFKPLLLPLVTPDLYLGILFLCTLPSTVQSSIAFTSVARGNVPAAVCSASASNLLGIFLTPILVGLVVVAHGQNRGSFDSIMNIVMQLLLPFIAGQIARRWISAWLDKHKIILKMVDQGSILLVVYTAFSEAVVQGLWQQLPPLSLLGLTVVVALLLFVMLTVVTFASRRLGFNKEDEITIVFCGSKKSLASGVPMAKVLFAGHTVGMIVLPLMLFHQIQLMVCAVLAKRYASRPVEIASGAAPPVWSDVSPED
ncbi:bile acid:sodium symporter family protein [Collimonas sp.]|jgi:sodium/bile acid cotransporter 7|uniref:bile acid:sodium symporter family protein n=1 Tax=Collimonas sp. TaxID=1963772 RepID=UPI002CA89CA5|nr:bile acid:sodium symporter family protein [Collimonas sp.]HWW07710.1 bile acid:sodium symporter family protein [Collimonas sp.]